MSLRTRLRALADRVLGKEPCALCATRIPVIYSAPVDGFTLPIEGDAFAGLLGAAHKLRDYGASSWTSSTGRYFAISPESWDASRWYAQDLSGYLGLDLLYGLPLRQQADVPEGQLRLLREPTLVNPERALTYMVSGSNFA